MKVFWSWQSDTPGKIGRFFVREALREAIEELRQAPDIEEPRTRESRGALHLDYDRKDVPGAPDLVRTIFDKIDVSTVVVADVTLVGQTPDRVQNDGKKNTGKRLISSNVAIELGYAFRALTDRHVVMVFNKHYGGHEDLPFDLRHKASIDFHLAPGADGKRVEQEKKKLKKEFVTALRVYLETPPSWMEMPSTFSKGAYFEKGEVLARFKAPDVDPISLYYQTDTLLYLRLIPGKSPNGPLSSQALMDAARNVPLLTPHDETSVRVDSNRYGIIGYDPAPHLKGHLELSCSTQLFQNGELWGINSIMIRRRLGSDMPLLLHSFKQSYYNMLGPGLEFASKELALKFPCYVECGLTESLGVHLEEPKRMGTEYPSIQLSGPSFGPYNKIRAEPITESVIVHRMLLKNMQPSTVDAILAGFFDRVYKAAGFDRWR
jgi:hypothetical protein